MRGGLEEGVALRATALEPSRVLAAQRPGREPCSGEQAASFSAAPGAKQEEGALGRPEPACIDRRHFTAFLDGKSPAEIQDQRSIEAGHQRLRFDFPWRRRTCSSIAAAEPFGMG